MRKNELNMTEGSILKNIILFAVPLAFSNLFQSLFNTADMIVVGYFNGESALAAIGATSSLIYLILNLFAGYATGTTVMISENYGAGNENSTKRTAHTSIAMGLLFGIMALVLGIAVSRSMLKLMGTPGDVLDSAVTYIRIYFLGMPASILYNFGSGILMAVGDTKRPFVCLTAAGVVNVVLNIIFTAGLKMGVVGVAVATVISQVVSAVWVLFYLLKTKESYGINLHNLKIHKEEFLQITKIGFPVCVQGSLNNLSNVTIQSAINTFGSLAVAGSAACVNIELLLYTIFSGISKATLTFTAQNRGAGRRDRIKKGIFVCLACQFVVVSVLGMLTVIFGKQLLGLYIDDPESIKAGMERLTIICSLYFMFGFNDSVVAFLRGMKCSLSPSIVTILGVCVFPILYVNTIFPHFQTMSGLCAVYPISWAGMFVVNVIIAMAIWKKSNKPALL